MYSQVLMVNELTSLPEERAISSTTGVGKIGFSHAVETRLLPYILYKINSYWVKDLRLIPEARKLLEEKEVETLQDISSRQTSLISP